jgi:hypothetical protein
MLLSDVRHHYHPVTPGRGRVAQLAATAHVAVVVEPCWIVRASRMTISGKQSTYDMPAA